MEKFNPEKVDFMYAPERIHMYSLPVKYWDPGIFEGICNTIGAFV